MRSGDTSFLPLSRRALISRVVATGVGGVVWSTLGSKIAGAQPSGLSQPGEDDLVNSVVTMGNNIADQPPLVQDWLKHSETNREGKTRLAQKQGFENDFHGQWANQREFVTPLNPLRTRFAIADSGTRYCLMGVFYHPWMHILGYAPNRTLNFWEVESLRPTTVFLERQFRLSRNGILAIAPFPDTPRISPTQVYSDGFARIVTDANLNPNNFILWYVRFYLMAVATSEGVQQPQPILAHAYTYGRSNDMQINYSVVRL